MHEIIHLKSNYDEEHINTELSLEDEAKRILQESLEDNIEGKNGIRQSRN